MNINLQKSLVAIYRGGFSVSHQPPPDLQSDYILLEEKRATQNFSQENSYLSHMSSEKS